MVNSRRLEKLNRMRGTAAIRITWFESLLASTLVYIFLATNDLMSIILWSPATFSGCSHQEWRIQLTSSLNLVCPHRSRLAIGADELSPCLKNPLGFLTPTTSLNAHIRLHKDHLGFLDAIQTDFGGWRRSYGQLLLWSIACSFRESILKICSPHLRGLWR